VSAIALPRPREIVRVYVWQLPVRLTHWLIAISILVLAATGFYIGHPVLVVEGEARTRFLMGTVRLVHSYAAIVFTLSVLSRVGWMFLGNTYARWDKFVPVRRRRRQGLAPTFWFYVFRLRKPPGFIGHNPLAGVTYIAVFALYFLAILTGFALYGAKAGEGSPMRLFAFLGPLLGGLQTARWIHHVVMWLLLGFAVHHVYSSVLMSNVEANGTALDGGTLGLSLLPHLEDADAALVLDAVRTDASPGSPVRITGEDVGPAVAGRLSPHQVGVADLLDAARWRGRLPARLVLLGVVPSSIELGLGLSAPVAARLPELMAAAAQESERLGFPLRPRTDDLRPFTADALALLPRLGVLRV
jgi:Ni/Fe-hydrogenase 1 B-type cytochrome subunit